MRILPSLNGLRAFEAAARLGSFTAAGDELHVSPAAISRLVRLLEERTGTPLFERSANRLRLTPAGRLYQSGLTPLFDTLESLTARVIASAKAPVLTIGVGPTFAVRWLIPRLSGFQAEHADIEVRFATGGAAAAFNDDWTCGIKLSDGVHPDFIAEPLFAADLVPVCTPELHTADLADPSCLKAELLLRVRHAPDDWQRWFKAKGLPNVEPKGATFEFYGHAIQAAADGVGIAMGLRPYIDDDVAAGRLIAPFEAARTADARRSETPQDEPVSKGMSWYLVHRPDHARTPAFQSFRDWIMREVGRRPEANQPSAS
ncbi:MAG: LysR substrate-binding domain-containing protein [Hyphomicrobiaceae bacterium]